MAIAGFNLETITLLALALVIGIIVDDAIVEVENIMRHMEAGESPRRAVLNASREISLTVSVSTLTIVAVFLPVAFMGGTVGQFFQALWPHRLGGGGGIPAAGPHPNAGAGAVLVAKSSGAVGHGTSRGGRKLQVRCCCRIARDQSAITRGYAALLQWALGHRWMVGWVCDRGLHRRGFANSPNSHRVYPQARPGVSSTLPSPVPYRKLQTLQPKPYQQT